MQVAVVMLPLLLLPPQPLPRLLPLLRLVATCTVAVLVPNALLHLPTQPSRAPSSINAPQGACSAHLLTLECGIVGLLQHLLADLLQLGQHPLLLQLDQLLQLLPQLLGLVLAAVRVTNILPLGLVASNLFLALCLAEGVRRVHRVAPALGLHGSWLRAYCSTQSRRRV